MPTLDSFAAKLLILADAPPIAGVKSAPVPAASDATPLGTPSSGANGAAGGAAPQNGQFMMFAVLALVMVLIMWLSSRSQKKEAKRRQEMIEALGRNDRVQTLGGVIGTIVEIKDSEIVLRVDESTGTRISFAKTAVSTVLQKGRGSESASAAA